MPARPPDLPDDFSPEFFSRLYRALKLYAFFWWMAMGMNFVYVPLFYNRRVGLGTVDIFLLAALTVVVSLVLSNGWSKRSDATRRRKPFILVGNTVFAAGNLFLLLVDNIALVFVYTFLWNAGPSSDAFINSLVYRLSPHLPAARAEPNPIKQKIQTYVRYRAYGSTGWAAGLPLAGLLISAAGFHAAFLLSSAGFAGVSVFLWRTFDEEAFVQHVGDAGPRSAAPSQAPGDSTAQRVGSTTTSASTNTNTTASPGDTARARPGKMPEPEGLPEPGVDGKPPAASLLSKIGTLLQTPGYRVLVVLGFVMAIAQALMSTNASLFVNLFARDVYALVGLYYSVGAVVEWPVMMLAARGVGASETVGWRRMLVIAYVFSGLKVLFNPLVILYDVPIGTLLLLSTLNGVAFGTRWPTTTYGIHETLEQARQRQESLGFSFMSTTERMGALVGNLLGAGVMSLAVAETTGFVHVYLLSAAIALTCAGGFALFIRQKNHDGRPEHHAPREARLT